MSISLRQDGGRKVTEDHVADHPETQFLGPIGLIGATGRPGFHFVILESSLRRAHDDIMGWLQEVYMKTVKAPENKHLLKNIDGLVKKINETAEARSFVCIQSNDIFRNYIESGKDDGVYSDAKCWLFQFNEAIWQEEGFSKVIMIQGRPWRVVPSVNVDSHGGEYFFIEGSCLVAFSES